MNKYGAMVEWFLQGKIDALRNKLNPVPLFHIKLHINWHTIEPGASPMIYFIIRISLNILRRSRSTMKNKSRVHVPTGL